MPIVALLIVMALAILTAIALLPLSLVLRYRAGTARRAARGWLIAINLVGIALSTAIFVAAAAVSNAWVPHAFAYTLIGLGAGVLIGLAGLALTRWESASQVLHYTPNRALVLVITLIVTARVLYGFWRSWHAWRAGFDDSWVVTFGVADSMAAGAVVLGYYLSYWLGVRWRLRRHRRVVLRRS